MGAAQNAAAVGPGDMVVVVGVAAVWGMFTPRGRLRRGPELLAVEPTPLEARARSRFGATHAVASLDEASDYLGPATRGRMADKVIMAMGKGDGRFLARVRSAVRQAGVGS